MKQIIGMVMIALGVMLGLYVGVWVCFIGGIAGLIDVVVSAVKGNGISGMSTAMDVGKIVFAGLSGYISAAVLIVPGVALFQSR